MADTAAFTDPFRVMRGWNERLVSGTQRQITDFVSEAERSLPAGWRRDKAREGHYSARGAHPNSVCFVRSPRDGVEVSLWLLRTRDTELQGGVIESTDREHYYPDVAAAARDFETGVLVPAAASGVRVTTKRPGPRSVVPDPVLDDLLAFLGTGERSWPLSDSAAGRWRRFVISAYRTETLLEPREFRGWLVAQGWSDSEADRLIDELTGDARLLADFKDELQLA